MREPSTRAVAGAFKQMGVMNKIAILVQGPLYRDVNGYSSVDVLKRLNSSSLRSRFYVVCALWEDEPAEGVAEIAAHADKIVLCPKPERAGAGNRNYHRRGVSHGLEAIEDMGFTHVFKTRSDFLVPEAFLQRIVALADSGFEKVLVTNLFTRFEPFHISDMALFSTFTNIKHWFDQREVYYEDLYSPEVQFARAFVRNKGLEYSMRLESYLEFLRDWIELVDFEEEGFVWIKNLKVGRRAVNAGNSMIYDRDCGAILCKLINTGFHRFLQSTRIPLSFVSTALRVADPLVSFALVQSGVLLRDVLRIKPRYYWFKLPSDRILEVKLGFEPIRYYYYTVDRLAKEHAKPVGSESFPPVGLPVFDSRDRTPFSFPKSGQNPQPGVFAVRIRKVAGEEAPS